MPTSALPCAVESCRAEGRYRVELRWSPRALDDELVCRVRLCSHHLERFKEATAGREREPAHLGAHDATDGGFD